jgi:hypothetical protein
LPWGELIPHAPVPEAFDPVAQRSSIPTVLVKHAAQQVDSLPFLAPARSGGDLPM